MILKFIKNQKIISKSDYTDNVIIGDGNDDC